MPTRIVAQRNSGRRFARRAQCTKCGFSVGEAASAFISGHATIEKRILRARKVLAQSKRLFDVAVPADFSARLPAVHRAPYLLFSEG
jgi:predicted RNA polymerase sigma factor